MNGGADTEKVSREGPENVGGRRLKDTVRRILTSMDTDGAVEALSEMGLRRVINPLFSLLCSGDDLLRWRAISAMGRLVARLADTDMEAGRVVMRRLMWNLNDESGGIGWGAPEAMGEIMACHEGLAEEFGAILMSYAREDGNYLEHEMLQRGLLWGITRLAQARPRVVQGAGEDLIPYLGSKDPAVRGTAARLMGLLRVSESREALERLGQDDALFETYADGRIVERRVSDLARESLNRLSS